MSEGHNYTETTFQLASVLVIYELCIKSFWRCGIFSVSATTQEKGCGCKMVIFLCRQRYVMEFARVWVVKSFWDWPLHPNVNQAVNCGAPLSRFRIQDNVFLELFQDYLPFSPLRFLSRSRSLCLCAQINQSDFEQRQLSSSKLGLYIHNASSHHHSYPPPQNTHIHTCT